MPASTTTPDGGMPPDFDVTAGCRLRFLVDGMPGVMEHWFHATKLAMPASVATFALEQCPRPENVDIDEDL